MHMYEFLTTDTLGERYEIAHGETLLEAYTALRRLGYKIRSIRCADQRMAAHALSVRLQERQCRIRARARQIARNVLGHRVVMSSREHLAAHQQPILWAAYLHSVDRQITDKRLLTR